MGRSTTTSLSASDDEELVLKKKESSYTYWKRDLADAHLFPKTTPLEVKDAASATELSASLSRPSAWNASGLTWEERDVFPKLREYLEIHLVKKELQGPGFKLTLEELKDVTGEATLCFSRGKGRMGYSLEISVKYEGRVTDKTVSGTLSVSEFTDTEPDANVNVSGVSDVQIKQSIATSWDTLLRSLIREYGVSSSKC